MDALLQALFSVSFIVACLGLSAITFVIRQIVEYLLDKPWVPAEKTSVVWKRVVLPILPVLSGGFISFFAQNYPYPENFTHTSARVAFGLVAGLLSGFVYRLIKAMLIKNLPDKDSLPQGETPMEQTVTDAAGKIIDAIKK